MLRSLIAVVALSLSAMTGCATIVSGKTQRLTFDSNPPGAQVKVDGAVIGVTPLTTEVPRKGAGSVEISKDGYRTQHTQLGKGLNPWFLGNIISGGVLSSTTDGMTGAVHEYKQDSFYASLDSEHIAEPAIANGTEKTNAVRTFVLVNFALLRREANMGGGEYVDAFNTLSFARDKKVYAASDLQKILDVCEGPVTCAEILAGDRKLELPPVKSVAQAGKPTKRAR